MPRSAVDVIKPAELYQLFVNPFMADQVPPEKVTFMRMEGVTVHIKVDSQAAQVYKAETTVLPKGMKGYIESSQGKRFTIHVKSSFGADLSAKLYIDGEGISRYALHGSDPLERLRSFMGKKDSLTSIRSFVFQPLSLTDNIDIAVTDEAIVKNIGSIKLKICRVVFGNSRSDRATTFGRETSKVLHERNKTATLSHATGLGEKESVPPKIQVDTEYIDDPTSPWLTFEFAYRSRDLLEIQGIIPTQAQAQAQAQAQMPTAGPSNTANQPGKQPTPIKVINIDSGDEDDEEPTRATPEIIIISSDDDEEETLGQEVLRLRKEIAALKKGKSEPKNEEKVKEGKGPVIER